MRGSGKGGFSGIAYLIFMQDSAPCHKCGSVREFVEEYGIETLLWPGNSPHMNLIENQ